MITLHSIYRSNPNPLFPGQLDHLQEASEANPVNMDENLAIYSEIVLQPAEKVRREANFDGEIIVYVRRGTIRCVDSVGRAAVTRAGGFARAFVRNGDSFVQGNESPKCDAQLIVIGVRTSKVASAVCDQQRRITAAVRRNVLCSIASRDESNGALQLSEDVKVFSAILLRGQHVVHELAQDRRVWLQVIEGKLRIGDQVAFMGDGVGVSGERAVSMTALIETELLLIDLEDRQSLGPR